MTILSKEGSLIQEEPSQKDLSTANSSLSCIPMNETQQRRIIKRIWRSIMEGNLNKLKSLQDQLLYHGQELSNARINKFGWTPLHAACYFGRLSIVIYLIEQDHADPNEVNPNGWHSLIFAVMGGHGSEIVEYLLKKTITDPLLTDEKGNNALAYAKSINPGGQVEQILQNQLI
ncbi:ankyrin [Stylonychia lemnae]|uniref:Ankyrin n=1 Tax=Stylonychia lemnae TaxID=5949 RepID=A0A078B8E3_STYLE|nr:ankyrin [Stylonychia lemnae]|eukprot:CDW89562.1 ankyrin [Stylonychia lemnae]